MLSINKKIIVTLISIFTIIVNANSQELQLANEADIWGPPQVIVLTNNSKIQLRTMFVKHYGTTCVFKVEFTNQSNLPIKETVQLINKDGIYTHWATDLRLNVNETAIYEMEKRECALTLSKKKQKDIKKCADCKPTIKFLKK